MYNPVSTYRLQFHKDFNFSQLDATLDYLHELGVVTLYASPVFTSVPGSTHGYDGLDPNEIDPEIGSLDQLRGISKRLKEFHMGWLQDIVPNHMAFHTSNKWLMDVLEKGERSAYKKYFDFGIGEEKLMVPFLGSSLEEAIDKNEIQLEWQDGKFVVKYFESAYPLNAASYANIIRLCCQDEIAGELAGRIDSLTGEDTDEGWEAIRKELEDHTRSGKIGIDLEGLNADKEILKGMLDQQFYRLCHWQETDSNINYRRFFTVNGLICMNATDPGVFEDYHQLVHKLVTEKVFHGLRVDHADGLYDPKHYLEQLRKATSEDTYIVIEKILGKNETLPISWPIQGNTGYDFLSIINNLLTDPGSEKPLSRWYSSISLSKKAIEQQARDKKAYILFQHMRGELDNLYRLFRDLQLVASEEYEQHSEEHVKTIIAALLIDLPVYRLYGSSMPLAGEEELRVRELFKVVRQTDPGSANTAFWLEDILLDRSKRSDNDLQVELSHFYKRLMQFSGPLMAKGVEDTLMYTCNRLLSRNEVGDSPGSFGITTEEFHRQMISRRELCPLSMNATATHDTKRGEDARARINVISDIPEEWIKLVKEWMQINAELKKDGAPDSNDEYMLYQAILGSYPLDPEEEREFPARLKAYLQKALREGKISSNWSVPNESYEENVWQFAEALLDKEKPFWKSFTGFMRRVSEHGIVNSIAQIVSKFTSPGIPDIYQGCELWDLSFVDPDNRRAVDYEKRQRMLHEIRGADPVDLWKQPQDGKIKLWVTHKLLQLRKEYGNIFTGGTYMPVEVKGKYRDKVIAWARTQDNVQIITVLPLHTAAICSGSVLEHDWADTGIVLQGVNGEVLDLFGNTFSVSEKGIAVQSLFAKIPFAILRTEVRPKERKAGVLLHITSLPSAFGIGDLGPAAYSFADLLGRSGQRVWQVLPLNPTSEGQAHSPYSATSAVAGNPLLISPDWLADRGWLSQGELNNAPQFEKGTTSFRDVEKWKNELFLTAWRNFQSADQHEFLSFCEKEHAWLHDFALYTLLKEMHGGKGWSDWPAKWKMRDQGSLEQLSVDRKEKIALIKWLQFIFHLQWNGLKTYANEKSIRIIGDLPFYVSYDSADVWVNRELFSLDENGNMINVAGVPPDAFSEDGQLWGMPVFDWEKLKQINYKWWVERIRKNVELFDAVRLDHFRAFSAYWEVKGEEPTAKNGKWIEGPGKDLFEVLRSELGELHFIAEDLGDIDEVVRQLRDQFDLPGMKVLQFAFGDDFGSSEFMPHQHLKQFVVYTGTHDNNTVKAWWESEADAITKARVIEYAGTGINNETVSDYFCRLAYASVADDVIIPVQDLLGLGGEARMNRPSSVKDNWNWRLLPGQLTNEVETKLRKWTRVYNR